MSIVVDLNSHQFGKDSHDAWGRPLMQPYDGHGAWNCNNYECPEHPQSMYEQNPGKMPGWLAHDTDPQRDTKRAVDKMFHESGMAEDAEYLMKMNDPK